MTRAVLRWQDADSASIEGLLAARGLQLVLVGPGSPIPGSYWGDEEAGLIGTHIYVRPDTPVHSILHEACHWLCMDAARRRELHTDAGGDDLEENAVCYLQILFADQIPGMDRQRMCRDMDAWGYSFRLGSAQAWFERDAADARNWLLNRELLPASPA